MQTRDFDLNRAALMLGMLGALSGPRHGGQLTVSRGGSRSMSSEERREKRSVAKRKRQARRKAKQ